MNNKKAYAIYKTNGDFIQYLKLSEANLIPKLVRDNAAVTVRLIEMTDARYKANFG